MASYWYSTVPVAKIQHRCLIMVYNCVLNKHSRKEHFISSVTFYMLHFLITIPTNHILSEANALEIALSYLAQLFNSFSD